MNTDYTLISTLSTLKQIRCSKLQLRRSGLRVILAECEAVPLLTSFLLVPSWPTDKSGLAHALEHLVFKASKAYSQKGFLDVAAALGFCDVPNASTHQSYTSFELSSTSESGWLQVLPALLQHVFHPLLDAEDFNSEVLSGGAESGTPASGVMYSELLSRECDPEIRAVHELYSLLFPEGYHEAGGRAAEVMLNLNLDKVRQFHSRHYKPHLSGLVVLGRLPDREDLIGQLVQLESSILPEQSGDLGAAERPPVRLLQSDTFKTVAVPNLQSGAMVLVGWILHLTSNTDLLASTVLIEALMASLHFTSASVGLCDKMEYFIDEEAPSAVAYLTFHGVRMGQADRLTSVLRQRCLDMADFHLLYSKTSVIEAIHRKRTQLKADFERDPLEHLGGQLISHLMLDQQSAEMSDRLDWGRHLDDLLLAPNSFWMRLMKRWSEQPWAVVQAVPETERLSSDWPVAPQIADGKLLKIRHSERRLYNIDLPAQRQWVLDNFPELESLTDPPSGSIPMDQYIKAERYTGPGRLRLFRISPDAQFCYVFVDLDCDHLTKDDKMMLILVTHLLAIEVNWPENQSSFAADWTVTLTRHGISMMLQVLANEDSVRNGAVWMSRIVQGSRKEPIDPEQLLQSWTEWCDRMWNEPDKLVHGLHQHLALAQDSIGRLNGLIKQKNLISQARQDPTPMWTALGHLRKSLFQSGISVSVYAPEHVLQLPDKIWLPMASLSPDSVGCLMIQHMPGGSLERRRPGLHRIMGLKNARTGVLLRSIHWNPELIQPHLMLVLCGLVQSLLEERLSHFGLGYGVEVHADFKDQLVYLKICNSVDICAAFLHASKAMKAFTLTDDCFLAARRSALHKMISQSRKSILAMISHQRDLESGEILPHLLERLLRDTYTSEQVIRAVAPLRQLLDARGHKAACTSVVCPEESVAQVQRDFHVCHGLELEMGPHGPQHCANLSRSRQKNLIFI